MSIYKEIRTDLWHLASNLDRHTRKKLELQVYSNIVNRMEHLCNDYNECSIFLDDMSSTIKEIKGKEGELKRADIRAMKKVRRDVESYLEEEHDLIRKGKYMIRYMTFGAAIGAVVGYFFMSFAAVGIFLGALVGIGIGTKLDRDAKNEGVQI
ncbi:MAG: glycine zipper family protein [Gudongella sp.]|nr:glycine zipper family protein [Gudongella sp.]